MAATERGHDESKVYPSVPPQWLRRINLGYEGLTCGVPRSVHRLGKTEIRSIVMWTNLATGTAFWAIGRAIAWTAAVAILGSSGVSAQTPRDRPDGPPAISREDAGALVGARIAALHSGLALTPEQERMWPAFEQAYREMARLRLERSLGAAPPPTDNPVVRMQRRADALARQGAALKGLADAAAPLWQSFDDGQKCRFAVLVRPANL